MDLVAGVKKVIILMEHNAKDGTSKLVKECNLPLTGMSVVNMIITDLGVFEIENEKIKLIEKAKDVSLEEIVSRTEANISS
jgi:3-oxoacid CoA-transferase subunit B